MKKISFEFLTFMTADEFYCQHIYNTCTLYKKLHFLFQCSNVCKIKWRNSQTSSGRHRRGKYNI